MGTASLTAVMSGGKYRAAEARHQDGFPAGIGLDVLRFARKRLSTRTDREEYVRMLRNVRPAEAEDELDDEARLGPHVVLERIAQGVPLTLGNAMHLAANSLFCEWGYVIDLDANTFEVYRGDNREPLEEEARFAEMAPVLDKYYPIRLSTWWNLEALPTGEEFILAFGADEMDIAALRADAKGNFDMAVSADLRKEAAEAEVAKLRECLSKIEALTWDPEARGLGATLPRDLTPSANRIIRRILDHYGLLGGGS